MVQVTIYLRAGEKDEITASRIANAAATAAFPPPQRNKRTFSAAEKNAALKRLELERDLISSIREQFSDPQGLSIEAASKFMYEQGFHLTLERHSPEDSLRQLAEMEQLQLQHWAEITGVGEGSHDCFDITPEAVMFKQHGEQQIQEAQPKQRAEMRVENKTRPLTFPCSPRELFEFISVDPGKHTFKVPDEFREALEAREGREDSERSEFLKAWRGHPEPGRSKDHNFEAQLATPNEPPASLDTETKQPPKPRIHRSTQQRSHPLTAVLNKARRNSLNPDDHHAIWHEFVKMAQEQVTPPLIGYTPDEGVKYHGKVTNEDIGDDICFYRKDALRSWLSRQKKKE